MNEQREQFLENPLPNSLEAERCVLGGILLNNLLFAEAGLILKIEDFYSMRNQQLFEAMASLRRAGKPVDAILLANELKSLGRSLDSLGGMATIANLTYGLPAFSSLGEYTRIVKEKSDKRKEIGIFQAAIAAALDDEKSAKEIATSAASQLVLIGAETERPVAIKDVAVRVRERVKNWLTPEKMFSVPTSIPELNAALRYGGFAPDDLIFVAARPSIGKTALMLDFLGAAGIAGIPSLGFSLEMSDEDLVMRMLPQRAGVKNMDIKPSLYRRNSEVQQRIEHALKFVERMPIELDSTSLIVEQMLAKAEVAVLQRGVKYVCADYLQLLRATTRARRRDLELEEISQALKNFARRMHVPVVCLAQLNRQADIDDRRPEMNDIREAGASEQIADVIIMPYRKDSRRKEKQRGKTATPVYREPLEAEPDESLVDVGLFIAKQRNGRAGFDINVSFDMDYQRFMSTQMWLSDRLKKFVTE